MVHDLIRHLVTWIYLHPNWAGLVLFLLSAGESMTLIGSFIPGTIVMTAVGVFIGADLLSYWPMVLWSAFGAIFGDGLNFTLGYYLKDNINQVWPFRTRQHWLSKGQAYFDKHGGKSIFFARFIGPLRAFAPVIAGALRMPAGKFYLMDSLSAFTWAIVYLLPGVLLGQASLELSPDITEHLFRFVFLTLVILIVGIWLLRLLVLHVNEVVKNALSCLWTKMKETPSFDYICHIFRHHKEDHPRGQLGTLFVLLLVVTAFVALTLLVHAQHPLLITYNNEAHHFIQSLRMQWLDKLMLIVTMLGQKEILAVGFIFTMGWLCYKRCWRAAIFWGSSFLLGTCFAHFFKELIQFHRPNQGFETVDSFSFPSGHVAIATVYYGGLAYLGANHRLLKFRWASYTIASLLITIVACSRLFLGVHWLSDILGGVLLGWSCLLVMALFYQRHSTQNIHFERIFPWIVTLQIVLTWGYLHHYQTSLKSNYFAARNIQSIESNVWWEKGYPNALMIATNRLGLPRELLNIQWAGNQNDIATLLHAQGWQSALEPHNWVLEIQHPEDKTPTVNLHLKARFFENHKPTLVFYKSLHAAHTYMVLQLWQTNITLTPTDSQIFTGELSVSSDLKESDANINNRQLVNVFLQSLSSTVRIKVIDAEKSLPPKSMPIILIKSAK